MALILALGVSVLGGEVIAQPAALRSLPSKRRAIVRSKSKAKKARKVRAVKRWHRRKLVQLQHGPGMLIRDPKRAWGTRLTVRALSEVLAAYKRQLPHAPPMHIHDISTRRGGRLAPHRSHRGGRDVDIRLALRAPYRKYVAATPRMLHIERTWTLLWLLYQTCDVQEVLLDRRLQRALYRHAQRRHELSREQLRLIFEFPGHRHRKPRPMVIHWPGHADHMHVRFLPKGRRRALSTISRPCGCPDQTCQRATLAPARPERRLKSQRLTTEPSAALDQLGL